MDRYIFDKLSDDELIRSWNLNRRVYFEIVNDQYIRRRLSKYKDIEKYKKENESWKQFFVRANYYITKMKTRYKFNYTEGSFRKYYTILNKHIDKHGLTMKACHINDLPLFLHGLQECKVYEQYQYYLYEAIINGSVKITKFLIGKGVQILEFRRLEILETVSSKGHLEMLKYLIEEYNFNLHDGHEAVLRRAAASGHIDIVKYAIEKGANINIQNGAPLASAAMSNHFDVVKYLVERRSIITPKAYEFSRKYKNAKISDYLIKHFEYKKLEV